MRQYQHWINGENFVSPHGEASERKSPWNNQPIAALVLGTPDDVDTAVAAARAVFTEGTWRNMAGSARGLVLFKYADLIEAKLEVIAQLEAEEAGKPLPAARAEIAYSVELIRFAASLAWNITGKLMHDSGPGRLGMVMYAPRGVVGMILPWNFPMVTLMQKLPYALAAGCSVVIKPSEFTVGTTLLIAKLAIEAGMPAGLVNVVVGTGATVGEAISTHTGIDMVSFTGSSGIGKRIAGHAATRVNPVALELGGKGANIIFADADIDAAVTAALQGFIFNAGQECCAGSRILVEDSIADDFVARLKAKAEAVLMDSQDRDGTQIGPLIHDKQMATVLGYIEKGKSEGATLLTGGCRPSTGALSKGLFMPPTIFTDVTSEMTIFKEEIFGPVASIIRFSSVDEAVSIANDTVYGLANAVWSTDLDKIMNMLPRLQTGMVYVNNYFETMVQLPFGGMKQSGMGRENGVEGLMEYMDVKAAFIKLKGAPASTSASPVQV